MSIGVGLEEELMRSAPREVGADVSSSEELKSESSSESEERERAGECGGLDMRAVRMRGDGEEV